MRKRVRGGSFLVDQSHVRSAIRVGSTPDLRQGNVGFRVRRQTLRVIRGGSWYSYRDYARVSSRNHFVPGNRGNLLGFRVVKQHA